MVGGNSAGMRKPTGETHGHPQFARRLTSHWSALGLWIIALH